MATMYRVPTEQSEAQSSADCVTLETRRDSLYQRLERGYAQIEHGLANERDMTTWEDFWIALLHEYEQVCNELQDKLAA